MADFDYRVTPDSMPDDSHWMAAFVKNRTFQYAQIQDKMFRELLERNEIPFTYNIEEMKKRLEGYEIVINEDEPVHTDEYTERRYTMKLCKIIDVQKYGVSFSIGIDDGKAKDE